MKNSVRTAWWNGDFEAAARRAGLALLVIFLAGCTDLPKAAPSPVPPGHAAVEGWRRCTNEYCGRDFLSAYSTFLFVNVDGGRSNSASVVLAPGRHWLEAHYAWGAGFVIGTGNYRNYGFELDVQADHRYQIRNVPQGCLVPFSQHWVSYKTLEVTERSPAGAEKVLSVSAMEYCSPASTEPGTCTSSTQCRSGICTPFTGATGFGMCGKLRE